MTLTQEDALGILCRRNVLMKGHFVLTSGRHSDAFVNLKLGLYPFPADLLTMANAMTELATGLKPDGFISPVIGGAALCNLVAQRYRESVLSRAPSLYADKPFAGPYAIKRGFDKLIRGRRVLVVNDNGSLERSRETIKAVHACDGNVVGIGYLFDADKPTFHRVAPCVLGLSGADEIDWTRPSSIAEFAEKIANTFDRDIDVVVGPGVHGALLAQQVASQICRRGNADVVCAFAEQDAEDQLFIPDAFRPMIKGRRYCIVEDVVTTGKSIGRVADLIRVCGGDVAGALAICVRGSATAETLGIPLLRALVEMRTLESWEAPECPLCRDHAPVNTDAGHGNDFLAKRARTAQP